MDGSLPISSLSLCRAFYGGTRGIRRVERDRSRSRKGSFASPDHVIALARGRRSVTEANVGRRRRRGWRRVAQRSP